jgi:hypothetical protein
MTEPRVVPRVHVGEEVNTELRPTVAYKVSRQIGLAWFHSLWVLFAQLIPDL